MGGASHDKECARSVHGVDCSYLVSTALAWTLPFIDAKNGTDRKVCAYDAATIQRVKHDLYDQVFA